MTEKSKGDSRVGANNHSPLHSRAPIIPRRLILIIPITNDSF
jgi:hypothetical protein